MESSSHHALELVVVLPLQDELVLYDLRPLQGSGVLRLQPAEKHILNIYVNV